MVGYWKFRIVRQKRFTISFEENRLRTPRINLQKNFQGLVDFQPEWWGRKLLESQLL